MHANPIRRLIGRYSGKLPKAKFSTARFRWEAWYAVKLIEHRCRKYGCERMIPKSGHRFSEKIMRQQEIKKEAQVHRHFVRVGIIGGGASVLARVRFRRLLAVLGIASAMAAAGLPQTANATCGTKGVYVFSAYWCPHCKHVQAMLARHGIAYQTIETTGNTRARALMAQHFNTIAIPVTVVDDSYVIGLNEVRLKQLLCIN